MNKYHTALSLLAAVIEDNRHDRVYLSDNLESLLSHFMVFQTSGYDFDFVFTVHRYLTSVERIRLPFTEYPPFGDRFADLIFERIFGKKTEIDFSPMVQWLINLMLTRDDEDFDQRVMLEKLAFAPSY